MKVKNIVFSGFMATILMAGAAYAESKTLATDNYVQEGVNYAIDQAGDYTDTEIGKIVSGATIAAKATEADSATTAGSATKATQDANGAVITETYLTKTDAGNTYLTQSSASSTYLTKTDASNTYATQEAVEAISGDVSDLAPVATSGSYADLTGVPTVVSAFTNDKDYQTETQVALAITEHDGAVDSHSDIRSAVNGKQDAITASAKLGADLVDDSLSTNKFVSADDKTSWNTAVSDLNTASTGLKAKMTAAEGSISSLQTTVGDSSEGLVKDVADNTNAISGLQGVVGDSEEGLVKDVADLQTTVGDSEEGLVKDVAALQDTVDGIKCGGGAGSLCLIDASGAFIPVTTVDTNEEWNPTE